MRLPTREPRITFPLRTPALPGICLLLLLPLFGCGESSPDVDPASADSVIERERASERDAGDPGPEIDPVYRQEIEALADDPGIREAFAMIEELEPWTMEKLVTITEIPAPPFMEDDRAEAYLEMLREAGLTEVRRDEEGNVIGVRPGMVGDRLVVISAHLDTVFPEGTDVTVEFRGDTLFAPGVGDDSRGLALLLTVVRALEEAGIETEADLWFVGTVGEEGLGDLRGVKHLFREGARSIDAFLSVDGGGDARVINQALGSQRYRVTFRGPGGHSWGDFGMANPAHALGVAIERFIERADEYVREGPRTSYNVGRVGGGTSVNSVPTDIWMEVDMRSIDPERLAGIGQLFESTMSQALERYNARHPDGRPLSMDLDQVGDRPSGAIPAEEPLIQRAMSVVAHFGWEPELERSSTDSNVPISLGIPSATIGVGGVGGGAHSLDEWWLNEDGHLAIQRTLLLLVAEAGLGSD